VEVNAKRALLTARENLLLAPVCQCGLGAAGEKLLRKTCGSSKHDSFWLEVLQNYWFMHSLNFHCNKNLRLCLREQIDRLGMGQSWQGQRGLPTIQADVPPNTGLGITRGGSHVRCLHAADLYNPANGWQVFWVGIGTARKSGMSNHFA